MIKKSRLKTTIVTILIMQIFFPITVYGKNITAEEKINSRAYVVKETIEISRHAANVGGSRLGLKLGDKITIKDLLYGLMLKSGNDCAIALAEYCGNSIEGFATLMNQKANELRTKKYTL